MARRSRPRARTLRARGARRADPPNWRVAEALEQIADLLEQQGANPFRVRAYRGAATTLRNADVDVADVLAERGAAGLDALPGIGPGLAALIAELVETGRSRLLDRLRGAVYPEDLLASLPGVGPTIAQRIHERLGIETLEELELAAWDARLETVPGLGPRRIEILRAVLAVRLGPRSLSRRGARGLPDDRSASGRGSTLRSRSAGAVGSPQRPAVADVLAVDAEYRRRAEKGTLPLIAPRRFNPRDAAWLPVFHTERGPWSFHALFSNTALAHRLGRTRDWTVIYYENDGEEGQATVVTETSGPLRGRRVVRGREGECEQLYQRRAS